jgi:hypothetical protein
MSVKWLFIFSMMSISIFAQNEIAKPTKRSKQTAAPEATGVLDFEGDLIEGQRQRPDLFMQSETQNLTLDAILFLRNDFNDFHQVQKNRRPQFYNKRRVNP